MADEILREMRRRIVKSFLDVIVLSKLNDGNAPMGIHDVINFVHREFGVLNSLDSTYAFLYSWEKDGLIQSENIGGAKFYSLTDKGKNTIKMVMQAKPRILNSVLEFLLIEI